LVLLEKLNFLASFAHVAVYSSNGFRCPEMTDCEEDVLDIVLMGSSGAPKIPKCNDIALNSIFND
jgi:hypothetical protein